MALTSFVGQFRARVVDAVGKKMEQAGARAVARARELVPVRTGQLRDSISYYWSREEMRLTLTAEKSYAAFVEARTPYLRPALSEIGAFFGGATAEVQFPNLPEAYHAGARTHLAGVGAGNRHRVIIGHRVRRRR
jgi:hypothetical protein